MTNICDRNPDRGTSRTSFDKIWVIHVGNLGAEEEYDMENLDWKGGCRIATSRHGVRVLRPNQDSQKRIAVMTSGSRPSVQAI